MTDEKTPDETNPAETFVCPVEDCRALIPDTLADRRGHRRGHDHRDKVDEAVRTALRLIRSDFATLRGETRDTMKRLERDVAGVDRHVRTMPTPPPPTSVRRGGWDDLDDDTADETGQEEPLEDWGDLLRPVDTDTPDEEPDAALTDPADDADEDALAADDAEIPAEVDGDEVTRPTPAMVAGAIWPAR